MDTRELRRLLSEATPGPWEAERFGCIAAMVSGRRRQVAAVQGDAAMHGDADRSADDIRNANTALIAAMRNALPELLDVVEAVRALGVARAAMDAANVENVPQWCAATRLRVDAQKALNELADRLAAEGRE